MGNDWAGFFFIGSGIAPAFLAWEVDPGLAIMVMVFLLFLGVLGGIADPAAPLHARDRRRGSPPR